MVCQIWELLGSTFTNRADYTITVDGAQGVEGGFGIGNGGCEKCHRRQCM
jgi:hypothetical protein